MKELTAKHMLKGKLTDAEMQELMEEWEEEFNDFESDILDKEAFEQFLKDLNNFNDNSGTSGQDTEQA